MECTELAFSAEVIYASRVYGWKTRTISSRTAIFRQINKDVPQVHHDANEFPDGTFVLLTYLHEVAGNSASASGTAEGAS
jgi:hypothetical protein